MRIFSSFLSLLLMTLPLTATYDISNLANESKEYGKVIGLTTASAIGYGVLHDQVTARMCLEYFTKGFHERAVHTWHGVPVLDTLGQILVKHQDSPTIVGAIWGVVATWWVGLPLGLMLALSARAGNLPKISMEDLKNNIFTCGKITGVSAALAALLGYGLHKNGNIHFYGNGFQGVPQEKMSAWAAAAFAHSASYTVGILSGLGLCLWTLKKRFDLSREKALNEKLKEQKDRLIRD